ncbi:MAG: amino acid ABC transporter substrate-binding protein [Anaerolineaceae bacterium]|nr:amino acid ABC transporter substrate-binding protein [Anaerolineaceae bacterium]OQY91386.1 MAG: amino acid ABC transporter substrate-binding protein [Anaerolineae bacterium UTCFX1]
MRKLYMSLSVFVLLALALAACGGAAPAGGNTVTVKETVVVTVEVPAASAVVAPSGYGETLKAVQARGHLVCGANAQVPGFGYVDSNGNYAGIDVDYCRALAAAVFGDATKVEFRPVTAAERFTALQSGEIDVLSRNTTWSLVRDTELGGNFTATTFYDGQGMMVPVASGMTTLKDLEGGTVCVQTGTTTELNLADVMAAEGVSYTPAVFEDADATFAAYSEGRCDAVTTDKSGLISRRSVLADPAAHIIMDVTMSKEPLGPMVRHGDDQWFDIAQWTVFTLFAGEEFGLTSANVDSKRDSATAPEIRRMLGLEGDLGLKLGLSNDFAYNIIKQVGNYAEIYDRNLGPNTPTYIPRGFNKQYTDGGLLFAPPFR